MGRNEGEDRPYYFKLSVPDGYNAYVTVFAVPEQTEEGLETADISTDVVGENSAPNCADLAHELQIGTGTTRGGRSSTPHDASAMIQNEKQPAAETERCIKMDDWDVATTIYFSEGSKNVNHDVELDVGVNVQYVKAGELAGDETKSHDARNLGEATQIEEGSPIAGGANFESAPEVTPGETFSDVIVDGEYRFYKFEVPYGKRPSVTVQGRPSVAEYQNYDLNWDFYNPMRASLETSGSMFVFDDEKFERTAADESIQWATVRALIPAPWPWPEPTICYLPRPSTTTKLIPAPVWTRAFPSR